MDINEFLGIAIVGAILSLIVKLIKEKFGTSGNATKLLTILLAIIVGGAYYFLVKTTWWETIIGILVAATTVYSFILKDTPLEKLFNNSDENEI